MSEKVEEFSYITLPILSSDTQEMSERYMCENEKQDKEGNFLEDPWNGGPAEFLKKNSSREKEGDSGERDIHVSKSHTISEDKTEKESEKEKGEIFFSDPWNGGSAKIFQRGPRGAIVKIGQGMTQMN